MDVITPPGTLTQLVAKLAYGPTWKDLEHEQVRVYVDTCTSWVELGATTTDDDGFARMEVDVRLPPGVYETRFLVSGDASHASASLWVLPVGTRVAIADVDGTLTTDDSELFRELRDGSYAPVAYPGAAALTRAHADRGHVVIYLTGRPSLLLDQTRAWLSAGRFADGPVHTADRKVDVLPVDTGVGAYKKAWIESLLSRGYKADAAYGNATTDIHAYTRAGIAPNDQWIIGPNGGNEGTHAARSSWTVRAKEIAASPRVQQPF